MSNCQFTKKQKQTKNRRAPCKMTPQGGNQQIPDPEKLSRGKHLIYSRTTIINYKNMQMRARIREREKGKLKDRSLQLKRFYELYQSNDRFFFKIQIQGSCKKIMKLNETFGYLQIFDSTELLLIKILNVSYGIVVFLFSIALRNTYQFIYGRNDMMPGERVRMEV